MKLISKKLRVSLYLPFCLTLLICLLGCGDKQEYVSGPFFSESGFDQITVGMSENEVRDLIGYPVSRFGPILDASGNDGTRIRWEYSAPASCDEPLQYLVFSIEFGQEGRVMSKLTCLGQWEMGDGVEEKIEAIRKSFRKIGDLTLAGYDGQTCKLAADDPGIYMILLDEDCREGIPQINTGLSWLYSDELELVKDGKIAGIKHFYLGSCFDEYQALIQALPSDSSSEFYLSTVPELGLSVIDRDSQILLYKQGTLWSMPAVYDYQNTLLCEEDQKWLIQRLAVADSAAKPE